MAKFNLIAKPGEVLDSDIKGILSKCFSVAQMQKLEKFGGRIQVSITAPFIDRKSQNSKLEITEDFINELRVNTNIAGEKLKGLTKTQLKAVAKFINYPVASKSNSKEILNGIIQLLQTPEQWKFIAGSSKEN